MTPLENLPMAFLDVETTGLSPKEGDRVIEVAVLKVHKNKVVDRFETLVNPKRDVSYGAYMVNGISDEMLKDAPYAENVLDKVAALIADSCLVGHNLDFDLGFLNNEFLLAGRPILEDFYTIDTIKMARGLLPELGGYSLSSVSRFLGVEDEQKHRSMNDVELTCKTFQKLSAIAGRKDLNRLDMLVNLFGSPKMKKIDNAPKVMTIEKVISIQKQLNILYFSAGSGTTLRKVTPTRVVGRGAQASLVGFCHLRNEERVFKIDRILSLEEI